MGTRGFLGFVADGRELIAYNHSDSYPESLGTETLAWLRSAVSHPSALRECVAAVRVVGPEVTPTDEDIERLAPWTNLNVGQRSAGTWYNLLHETQGKPWAILHAGVLEDASGFPLEAAARWGYLVDLDAQVFEVYRGGQKEPHDKGRFAARQKVRWQGEHFPCALVVSWPLADLPAEDVFVETLQSD